MYGRGIKMKFLFRAIVFFAFPSFLAVGIWKWDGDSLNEKNIVVVVLFSMFCIVDVIERWRENE